MCRKATERYRKRRRSPSIENVRRRVETEMPMPVASSASNSGAFVLLRFQLKVYSKYVLKINRREGDYTTKPTSVGPTLPAALEYGLFDARDEERDNENEYDGYEDNEALNESLSSLVRETTRNCSAVFLTWSKFPDLENGVKPELGWYANYVYAMFPRRAI
ncbi:hypothetical protein V8E54_002327 [Elaphomyces granulatus]